MIWLRSSSSAPSATAARGRRGRLAAGWVAVRVRRRGLTCGSGATVESDVEASAVSSCAAMGSAGVATASASASGAGCWTATAASTWGSGTGPGSLAADWGSSLSALLTGTAGGGSSAAGGATLVSAGLATGSAGGGAASLGPCVAGAAPSRPGPHGRTLPGWRAALSNSVARASFDRPSGVTAPLLSRIAPTSWSMRSEPPRDSTSTKVPPPMSCPAASTRTASRLRTAHPSLPRRSRSRRTCRKVNRGTSGASPARAMSRRRASLAGHDSGCRSAVAGPSSSTRRKSAPPGPSPRPRLLRVSVIVPSCRRRRAPYPPRASAPSLVSR